MESTAAIVILVFVLAVLGVLVAFGGAGDLVLEGLGLGRVVSAHGVLVEVGRAGKVHTFEPSLSSYSPMIYSYVSTRVQTC